MSSPQQCFNLPELFYRLINLEREPTANIVFDSGCYISWPMHLSTPEATRIANALSTRSYRPDSSLKRTEASLKPEKFCLQRLKLKIFLHYFASVTPKLSASEKFSASEALWRTGLQAYNTQALNCFDLKNSLPHTQCPFPSEIHKVASRQPTGPPGCLRFSSSSIFWSLNVVDPDCFERN